LIIVLGVVLLGKAVIGFLTSASISFLFQQMRCRQSRYPLADSALANLTVALAYCTSLELWSQASSTARTW
jgi:hypothetical protein